MSFAFDTVTVAGTAGIANAVLFWFDLHLDEQATLSNAPEHLARNGIPARQALQYLDSALAVQPGQGLPLLMQRAADSSGALHWALPQGVGLAVPKSPWLVRQASRMPRNDARPRLCESGSYLIPAQVEWQGGASIENPHRQRVQYTELLVQDLLQRLPSGRFPSVEADLKLMQAHCGALFLEPAGLAEVRQGSV